MDFSFSPDLDKKVKKIIARNQPLARKIQKQLSIFEQNHLHPSLRLHKLTGNLNGIWSISIDKSIRMLYFLNETEAYFFDIGTHDQVYSRN